MTIKGRFEFVPPLSEDEIFFFQAFNRIKRVAYHEDLLRKHLRENGVSNPLSGYINIPGYINIQGVSREGEFYVGPKLPKLVKDENRPPSNQPTQHCGWTATNNGKYLVWDGSKDTTYAIAWAVYLLKTVMRLSKVQGQVDCGEWRLSVIINPRQGNYCSKNNFWWLSKDPHCPKITEKQKVDLNLGETLELIRLTDYLPVWELSDTGNVNYWQEASVDELVEIRYEGSKERCSIGVTQNDCLGRFYDKGTIEFRWRVQGVLFRRTVDAPHLRQSQQSWRIAFDRYDINSICRAKGGSFINCDPWSGTILVHQESTVDIYPGYPQKQKTEESLRAIEVTREHGYESLIFEEPNPPSTARWFQIEEEDVEKLYQFTLFNKVMDVEFHNWAMFLRYITGSMQVEKIVPIKQRNEGGKTPILKVPAVFFQYLPKGRLDLWVWGNYIALGQKGKWERIYRAETGKFLDLPSAAGLNSFAVERRRLRQAVGSVTNRYNPDDPNALNCNAIKLKIARTGLSVHSHDNEVKLKVRGRGQVSKGNFELCGVALKDALDILDGTQVSLYCPPQWSIDSLEGLVLCGDTVNITLFGILRDVDLQTSAEDWYEFYQTGTLPGIIRDNLTIVEECPLERHEDLAKRVENFKQSLDLYEQYPVKEIKIQTDLGDFIETIEICLELWNIWDYDSRLADIFEIVEDVIVLVEKSRSEYPNDIAYLLDIFYAFEEDRENPTLRADINDSLDNAANEGWEEDVIMFTRRMRHLLGQMLQENFKLGTIFRVEIIPPIIQRVEPDVYKLGQTWDIPRDRFKIIVMWIYMSWCKAFKVEGYPGLTPDEVEAAKTLASNSIIETPQWNEPFQTQPHCAELIKLLTDLNLSQCCDEVKRYFKVTNLSDGSIILSDIESIF